MRRLIKCKMRAIKNENLLSLVNIWQLGGFTLLADDWDTVRISLSDLVSLGLSLLYSITKVSHLFEKQTKS